MAAAYGERRLGEDKILTKISGFRLCKGLDSFSGFVKVDRKKCIER